MLVDCLNDRSKTLYVESYSKRNLEGDVVSLISTPDAKWVRSYPNSAASEIQGRVCSLRLGMPETQDI
jgi:hypothetical protein